MDIQKVREALITAIDAMGERRGYSEAFEYKYKDQWDEDDKIVREALAGLDKPADEIKIYRINKDGVADHCDTSYILLADAEAYLARKLAELGKKPSDILSARIDSAIKCAEKEWADEQADEEAKQ